MLNFLEVKELRSYRSRGSLGVKPLVLSKKSKNNKKIISFLLTDNKKKGENGALIVYFSYLCNANQNLLK